MAALWLGETNLWVPRKLEEDFGIDLEAELVEPEVRGHILFATMLERADTQEALGLNRSRLRSTRPPVRSPSH
jgi:hypothetical protein